MCIRDSATPVVGCNTIDSPGDARLPITVASLDKDLNLAVYSSRGYTSDGRVKPDVATIGSSIWAPDANTVNDYSQKSGTSMATPLMAGIVALTLAANPDLTPTEIKETLVAGFSIEREILNDGGGVTNDCSIAETRPDNEYGYGQADPLVFVEIAGKIDPDVSINKRIVLFRDCWWIFAPLPLGGSRNELFIAKERTGLASLRRQHWFTFGCNEGLWGKAQRRWLRT